MGFGAPVTSYNQFNDNTPTQVGAIPKDIGRVKRTKDGVVYFDGLKQVDDPTIVTLTNLQALNQISRLKAITDSSGKMIMVNPTPGFLGSMSQTILEGPGTFVLNMNLIKRIRFPESRELMLRADAVNLLNRPIFGFPDTNINSTTFGRITTATGSRVVLLNARVDF